MPRSPLGRRLRRAFHRNRARAVVGTLVVGAAGKGSKGGLTCGYQYSGGSDGGSTCQPSCAGVVCGGDDGCDGSCGTCPAGINCATGTGQCWDPNEATVSVYEY